MTRSLIISLCFLTAATFGYRNISQQPSVSMNPLVGKQNYSNSNGRPKIMQNRPQGLAANVLPEFNAVDDTPTLRKTVTPTHSHLEIGGGSPVYTSELTQNKSKASDFYKSDFEQNSLAHHHHSPNEPQQPHFHPVSPPTHTHAHSHPVSAYQPPIAAAPVAAPGLHQNLTMNQIVSYLFGPYGPALSNQLHLNNNDHVIQCKTYCDALPADPTCDSSNTLYRNECEAKCISRDTSKTNLRYGMCCCNSDDFDYEESGSRYFDNGTTAGRNMCITRCIRDCLGGESSIEDEHEDPQLVLESDGADACVAINS